jgi:ribonucleoside-diphosphate reductase alpha chain
MDYPAITLNKDNLRDMAQLVLSVNEEFANKIGINLASRTTCVKPEGTASCLLGTSSGIHPSHSRRYIRRVQSNSNENPIQHFKKSNPQAVGVSAWSANKTDEFITFLIEMPDGVITKQHMGAIQLLETVKLVQENWVEVGKRKDLCVQPWLSHNVSNTINVKDGEWPAVEEFIYSNRHSFAGISLLGDKGDLDFNQAPFSKVLMADELVAKYGSGVMFSSGLIVDALHAFDSLWTACDSLLGIYQLKKPDELETVDDDKIEKYQHDIKIYFLQKDWMRRARQFADRYVGGNIRELTYLLKDVNNNKLWLDLGRVYKDVDYTTMMEDDDNTKLSETVACSSGACETMA